MKKKFAICLNNKIENSIIVKNNLEGILRSNSIDYEVLDTENLEEGFDFVFVIGGDGTILKTARFYSDLRTPVLGVNLGRLGFLSQATPDDLDVTVKKVLNGEYKVEKRMMLGCGKYSALNDFVVKGGATGRTSRFALKINGKFVCEYLADGIIISTPTGSTAYGMAAGGPVLAPQTEAIAVVPICPHTFSARPIVVPAVDEIKIIPCPNNEYTVSVDGQFVFELNEELRINKLEKKAYLALLNENDFYSVLRNKLQWGISPAKMK